jgi:hypothetical protein
LGVGKKLEEEKNKEKKKWENAFFNHKISKNQSSRNIPTSWVEVSAVSLTFN